MRYTLAPLALAALVAAKPLPQSSSSSCSPDYDGTFQIQVVKEAKRGLKARQNDPLVISLSGGTLTDSQGRTGYVASNSQFQFDAPPQAGALATSGFEICDGQYLSINGDDTWYQCLSGTFYNLYDDNVLDAGQCSPVHIVAIGGSAPAPSGGATQIPDGQITASGVASQIPDGQVTASAVSQIPDGQIQAPSAAVTQIPDGQIQAPSAPVTQISDGQIQAPSAPVTQISDGQIQAPSAPVTQISDGQIQAPSAPVVTQISDGQIQAPYATGTGAAYYPTGTGAVYPSASIVPAVGGAASSGVGKAVFGLAAGVLAVAML